MYSKFNINKSSLINIGLGQLDTTTGSAVSTKYKSIVDDVLKDKFEDNKFINGSKIQEDWFPQVKCDIFLSHSHKDIDKAKQFAGWLKNKFDLDVFLDYNIWGNIYDLLQKIDYAYCYDKNSKTYNYKKRNFTTSHVHMMLMNALSDMINRTECLMFFETPNSINLKEMTHSAKTVTESPWIYNELFLSKIINIVQRREQNTLIKAQESVRFFSHLNEGFNPSYETDITHLIDLSQVDFANWLNVYKGSDKEVHPLDVLYTLKNIK